MIGVGVGWRECNSHVETTGVGWKECESYVGVGRRLEVEMLGVGWRVHVEGIGES